jgi:polysaccharide deacetylase family protein (PEP-CTERM system associated)
MVSEGHEVASHGFGHLEVGTQTPAEFREDVRRAKALLEDLTGVSVKGYRAPDFTLGNQADWAMDILAKEGYRYDASVFPSGLYRNGVADWPAQPVMVRLQSGLCLMEIPAATVEWQGRRWPVAGGGYHRLLPGGVVRQLIRAALARSETFVAYCHPYEFDPDEFADMSPRIPWKTRLHQGLGRRGFDAKFRRILSEFDCARACDLLVDPMFPEYVLMPRGHTSGR